MTYKCKICGGSIVLDQETGIAECEYCGTKQTLPQFSDENTARLYESGNKYLQNSEYDKAEQVFVQLLSVSPQDSELYWSLCLCKYGVTFVLDPRTKKYIPTCNRTHFESILKDENYQKALQFSSDEKKSYYEETARIIDDIQRGILAISRKEKPFDVFISYKESDGTGNRTEDSIKAQELYERLTAEGYKVFFSRITLENKVGSKYEPYIYAALSSSKVMLTVSSTRENIEAPWVKNEWNRFLVLRQADPSKNLIPLYYKMSKSELPEEFAILSANDMEAAGFEQELIRGIKKLIPLPIMVAEHRKKIRKRISVSAAIIGGVLVVSGAISAPFIAKYVKNNNAYKAAMALYEGGDYIEASDAFALISGFKDADEMVQTSLYAETNRIAMGEYNAAMQLYYDGKYAQASWAFRDMDGYKDSAEMQKKCELAWRESHATIATSNYLSFTAHGAYYITANGSVETFLSDPGSCHSGIDINAHGKIVSIGDNYALYALYEDGYVANSAGNNQMEKDWENVIQITPLFNATNVALKSDGTVEYGNTQNKWNDWMNDDWLTGVSEWKSIISLSWGLDRLSSVGETEACLIGIDEEGKAHVVSTSPNSPLEQFLSSLVGINEICIGEYGREVTVLMEDGTIYTYSSGSVQTIQDVEAKSIGLSLYIDKKGQLRSLSNGSLIVEDAVYICDGFFVTQSGNIYSGVNKTEGKTKVHDVWLAR